MSEFGEPEKVHIELEWYDGPREGIAEVQGKLSRFKSVFSEEMDDYISGFIVFPVSEEVYNLEKEQWLIFVRWNTEYENGQKEVSSHPGIKGNNKRWEEINALLKDVRNNIPTEAKTIEARFVRINQEKRYEESGPDYMLSWAVIPQKA